MVPVCDLVMILRDGVVTLNLSWFCGSTFRCIRFLLNWPFGVLMTYDLGVFAGLLTVPDIGWLSEVIQTVLR